jgi:hypothetical protein
MPMPIIETIQITVHASDIVNTSKFAGETSNPTAYVTFLPNDRDMEKTLLGKTEINKNNLNPDWRNTFTLNYELGSDKPAYILVKIIDTENYYMEMGDGIFEIGEVLRAENNTMSKKLKNGGKIDVHADRAVGRGSLKLEMSGVSLKNARRFDKKSLPFYKLTRKDVGQRGIELSTVHVSEKIGKKSLNPNWQKETIDLNTLCSGNLHLPLVMSVYHHKSNGKHVLMGEMETSVSNLLSCQKSGSKLKLKKGGIKTGKILINRAETESLVIKISDEEIETTTTISFEDSETIQLVEQ